MRKLGRKLDESMKNTRNKAFIKANILDSINETILEGTGTPSNLADSLAERYPSPEPSGSTSPVSSDSSSGINNENTTSAESSSSNTDQLEGPPSPTNSNDSSETVKEFKTSPSKRDIKPFDPTRESVVQYQVRSFRASTLSKNSK